MSVVESIKTTEGIKLDPQSIHMCTPLLSKSGTYATCRRCGLLLRQVGPTPEYYRPYIRNGNFSDIEFANFDSEVLLETLRSKEIQHRNTALRLSNQRERSEIIEKCLTLSRKCQFSGKTYYLSVAYIDVVLSRFSVRHAHKQLIGMVCVFLAAKMTEKNNRLLPLENYLHIADCLFSPDQFFTCEAFICNLLHYKLNVPTAFDFLNLFCGRGFICEDDLNDFNSDFCLKEQAASSAERLALLYLEFCVRWYEFSQFRPSVVAVSCMIWARKVLNFCPWTAELEALTQLKVEDVAPCMALLQTKFNIDKIETLNRFSEFIRYVAPVKAQMMESSSSQESHPDIKIRPQIIALQAILRRKKIKKTSSHKRYEVTFLSAPESKVDRIPGTEEVNVRAQEIFNDTFDLPNQTFVD